MEAIIDDAFVATCFVSLDYLPYEHGTFVVSEIEDLPHQQPK